MADTGGTATLPLGVAPAEAARLTGCSKATIIREFHRGNLPGVQLGKKILISRAAIDSLVAKLAGGEKHEGAATTNA